MSPAVAESKLDNVSCELDANNNAQCMIDLNNNNSSAKQAFVVSAAAAVQNSPDSKTSTPYVKKEKVVITSISKTNLYIRGLDERTTDQDLYSMCQKFGQIKSTKAIVDKETMKCKGYGFVDFKSPYDALCALNELKREQRDVQLAKQREQDPTNLYFANLPPDVDEPTLNTMLKSKFNANISSTRIMREGSGDSKGVGFCRIDSDKVCTRIIQELNGKPFPDNNDKLRCIMVKLADSSGFFKVNSGRKLKNYFDSSLPSEMIMNNSVNNGNHSYIMHRNEGNSANHMQIIANMSAPNLNTSNPHLHHHNPHQMPMHHHHNHPNQYHQCVDQYVSDFKNFCLVVKKIRF
jgi:hypothetical protein